jgi:acetyl-CoA carboxylase biotin carboxyl carrier protein
MKETAPPAEGTEARLDAIFRHALRLLGTTQNTPSRLRIEADGTCVEMEWPAKTVTLAAAEPAVQAPGPVTVASMPAAANGHGTDAAGTGLSIRAATVGTFYHAPEPGAAPFVRAGDDMEAGRQVGILEVMKLMTPVVADRPGRVLDFLVPDGTPVEYGQPLISFAPLNDS